MNSLLYHSNSAKTIEVSKNEIDSYTSKNIKKRLNICKNKTKKHNKSSNSKKEILNKTTFDFFSKNIINNYNRLTPSCLRRNKTNKAKYGNFFIFGKRELAFNKSIRDGRKVFKYHQSTFEIDDKKNGNSLYLTEALLKRNKSMLPLIDKDKSTSEDIDLSNINYNKEKKEIKKDLVVLKNINLNKEQYKERKEREEYLASRQLIKKNKIISKYNVKEKSLNNFIINMKYYCIDKYTLDVKKEKYKVINENIKNKIENANDAIRELNSNSKLFAENFCPSFNEYIKQYEKQRDAERQKDLIYLNKIYLLQKKISILKNKINKRQNEKDHLMRAVFLQIKIKEKKLHLPEYYKDILTNSYDKNGIKEKYGKNISDKEIDRILEYKNKLIMNEDDVVVEKIKRLENDNIELMNNYNKIRSNIFYLKNYKNQIEDEIKKDITNDIDSMVIIKEKVLENIIKKYKKLSQDKIFLIKNKSKKKKRHSKLYYKIELLFNNLNDYKKFDFSENIPVKIESETTEEIQIIQIMKKIERITSYILEKNRQYLINNKEQIQTLQNLLAKKKKIEKTNEQKRNIIIKFEKERKKIFEKNSKILFLPKRKLSIFNIFDKKINSQKSKSQQKIKIDLLNDYLYD